MEALRTAIASAKANDPLAPVTVIPPSNYAGLWLRRRLARERGLVNVRFMSLARLAEFVGAAAVGTSRTRPLTPVVAAEATRRVLAEDPGLFAPVAGHPSTVQSLINVFRELDEVDKRELSHLAARGGRTADIVRLYGAFRQATSAYYTRSDLFHAAAASGVSAHTAWRDLGQVVLYLPGALAPSQQAFSDALVASGNATIIGSELASTPPVANRIVTVTDIDEEVRTVVSLILADLEAGVPAAAIACYYPLEDVYQPLLVEQLKSANIPFNTPAGSTLASTPPGRALLGLLAMEPGGLSRKAFVGWIASAPIRDGARPVPVRLWNRLTRDAGIVGGPVDRWAVHLQRYREDQEHRLRQAREDGREGQAAAIEHALEAADWLRTFLTTIVEAIQSPPVSTWSGWSTWARDLLTRFLDAHEVDRLDDLGRSFLEAVFAGLDELSALDALVGEASIDRDTFRQAVEQMLENRAPAKSRFGNGVFVAPLPLSAGIDTGSTYILGCVEGVLPAPLREDSLLSDGDRATVGSLPGPRQRLDELRLLYMGALNSARVSTLSYPVGNLRRGREQLPSRWLLESASVHVGKRIDSRAFAELREQPWLHRSPSLSARLLDSRLPFLDASEHEVALMRLQGPASARRPGVRAGIDVVHNRVSARFTRFDGNIAGALDPDTEAVMSPTRLETYARCPHRYFLGSVLRVAEFDEPEEVRSLSALDRGTIIHDTLDQFYRETSGRDPGPWTDDDRQRLTRIAHSHCERFEQLGRTGGAALWNIEKSRILAELVDYLDADAERTLANGTSYHDGEIAFGEPGGWPPVEIPLGSRTLRFRGRIDRVDRGANPGEYWVYDYKTGSDYGLRHLKDDPLKAGQRLQLPIYAEAVRSSLEATSVHTGYWMVSDAGAFKVRELPVDEQTRADLVVALQHISDGIAAGVFIPNPGKGGDNCTYCPYAHVCPADKSRAFERKIGAPENAPYAALVETSS